MNKIKNNNIKYNKLQICIKVIITLNINKIQNSNTNKNM